MNPVVSASAPEPTAARPRAGVGQVARDLVALTKPRITLVVLMTAACGMKLAGHASGRTWLLAMVGTALIVGAANTLNMWLERDVDGLMERTRRRPLPAGRLSPSTALVFGIALAIVSLPILAIGVNAMTGLLGAVALVSYVLMYTPMKRHSLRALWVGGIPGAIPPLLGWAAVTGSITAPGLSLFAVLFVWQIPHFIAISVFRADDYARAGLKVVPVELGEQKTNAMMLRYAVILFALTYWPFFAHVGGYGYLGIATLLGVAFVAACAVGYRKKTADGQRNRWARGVFAFSILYLVALFVALVAGA